MTFTLKSGKISYEVKSYLSVSFVLNIIEKLVERHTRDDIVGYSPSPKPAVYQAGDLLKLHCTMWQDIENVVEHKGIQQNPSFTFSSH